MAARFCPKCKQTYAPQQRVCPADQEVLSLRDPYHLVGRVLMGKYRVDALVGLGGMGAVYCVEHLGISRRVAFKILQPNIAVGDEQIVRMFEREAKLVGRLHHENIVDVKDAGQTDEGISYIVMEWLEGRTLEEELATKGQIPFPRLVTIAQQIASALVEAHKNQIIHRDLKPSNVMLIDRESRGELVKVLDFGISKAFETTGGGPVSAIVGTPHYASLEQLTVGERIDGRSDLYSLGVILYRSLSGTYPYNGNSMGELIHQQMTFTPPSLYQLRPTTPLELVRLVTRLIAKTPAERPSSAEEVIAALDRLNGLPDPADVETDFLPEKIASGETTIQKPRRPLEEPTEVIKPFGETVPISAGAIDYSTAVLPQAKTEPIAAASAQATSPKRSPWLLGALAAVAVAAGGYGVYRSSDSASFNPQAQPQESPRTAQTPAIPTPTAPIATPSVPAAVTSVKVKPSPKPKPNPTKEIIPPPARPEPTVQDTLRENLREAEEHYRRAEIFYEESRYRMALMQANAALRLNPNHAKALELKRKVRELGRILKQRR